MESEDDWVGIALGPSEAPAGPPREVLLFLYAIHVPPFWGARESNGALLLPACGIPNGCGACCWVSDVRLSGS